MLEAVESTMSSYTYTDISPAFFAKAADSLAAYRDKMIYQVLDIEKPPVSQGYKAHSYDIVIAFNVLHATRSLQTTLANTRQLLKPGGYLLLLEFTNNDPIRFGTTMAGLPGWWLGADDGRVMMPTVSTRAWHSTLRKAGFSGVDTTTPEIDGVTWPISILVSQAVDNQVNFLRRPLSSISSTVLSSSVRIESLVILGTGTLVSSRIAEEIAEYLEPFCDEITILDGLPSKEQATSLSPLSIFVNLADLDTPIFKSVTTEKMEGLKRMFDLAKHVLWITQGALMDEPYHMASIMLSRTIRREAMHVSLNHLDISDPRQPSTSKSIAEHLLRLYALDEWEAEPGNQQRDQQLLWSKEPEVFLDGGKFKVPRLIPNADQNARLNASRRAITKMLSVSSPSANAAIVQSPGNSALDLVEITTPSQCRNGGNSLVSVKSSSLMAVPIAADTFLFLGAGSTHDRTGSRILSLSTTNSYRTAPVARFIAPAYACSNNISTEELVIATTGELIADSIMQHVSLGARVLIHCSSHDSVIISALRRSTASNGIQLILTCNADNIGDVEDQNVTVVRLSARGSQHSIRRTLYLARPTHFIDLTIRDGQPHSHSSDLGLQITRTLPTGCRSIDASAFFQRQSSLPKSFDGQALARHLEASTLRFLSTVAQTSPTGLLVSPHKIWDAATPQYAASAVRWPSDGTLEVHVRSLDARGLFSRDKTYLLVGLTGQIGQSLCEFMVLNGAGCVCLMSRRPEIDGKWLASVRESGVDVKVLSMDVTDRSSLEAVVRNIRATCPPIAGVAHGAMYLSDALFSKMETDEMIRVLRPKIDGANNLDQIFGKDDLEFFVLFSSVACVVGNVGQSVYSAASGYLNGLARQRRRRGLAASVFDIGRVVGLGYLETAEQHVLDWLLASGLQAISESDLRQAFAETILMGYPNPSKDREDVPHAAMTLGIRYYRDDEDVKGPYFTNPLFSHLVIESASIENGLLSRKQGQDSKTTLRVAQQLLEATSIEQAREILQGKL